MSLDRPLLRSLRTMERPTPSARPPTFELAALAHPAWWAALAVLLVNDHLLKGHGVVPGWLTGKLSDFAFVIVAPTLFAALLPRALPGRRTLAVGSVIGLYVAADLSRAVSDGFVAVMAHLGIVARLWPDVTDLLALAVLPVTIHLLRLPTRPFESRGRFTLKRIGVMLGAAACVATTAVPGIPHHPFLFNATSAAKTVRVTWVLRDLPCDPPETVASTLTASDLDDTRTLDLASGQVAALDGIPAAGVSPVGVCEASGIPAYTYATGCVGAILEADGAAPVLMVAPPRWEEEDQGGFIDCTGPPPPVSLCKPHLAPASNPGPDAVSLRLENGQLTFAIGPPKGASDRFTPPSQPVTAVPKVRIGPIDPAAVAARPPASTDGCRVLRSDYLTLITSPTCAVDLDCVGRRALLIEGGPACDIAINIGAAAMIQEIDTKWNADCQAIHPPPCAGLPQPAVCREGHCAPACPGVAVPSCLETCSSLTTPVDNQSCDVSFRACRRPDGKTCSCSTMRLKCVAPTPVSATCPLTCIEAPGGGTFTPP